MEWILERIKGKVEGWKEPYLNHAGKEVLIKVVIQTMPSYAMAMILFPKSLCKTPNSMVARFWWRSRGKEKEIHWCSKEKIYVSKSSGGLGFRDFIQQNMSYLGKQAWRLYNQPNTLWGNFSKAIYFPNTEFMKIQKKKNSS